MSIKPLNPILLREVEKEIHNWQHYRGKAKQLEPNSDLWNICWKQQRDSEKFIKAVTGLSDRQLQSLLKQTATTAKYWKPSGEIQKDY